MLADADRKELRQRLKAASGGQEAASILELGRQLLAESGKPADTMFCASSFLAAADVLAQHPGTRRLKTYLVRSVTLEPLIPCLIVEAAMAGFVLDLKIGGYGSYVDELLNSDSILGRSHPDLVLVVLDLEDIAGNLPDLCATGVNAAVSPAIDEAVERMAAMLRNFRANNSARLLLQGLVVPDATSLGDVGEANLAQSLTRSIQQLNQRLATVCGSISDCVFFDVDHLAARHGRGAWRDARMFLASRLPIASDSFVSYTRGIVRSFSTLFRAPRKILCTDLDNTLWGGILGEDGVDGILTGTSYPGNCYLEYQKYLKQLSSRGILLAAVSKNNESDVREAFQVRSSDLTLTLDDFVALKISWNEKAASLRELADELSLGLDSFVFVDDNPVECAAIRQQLPQVLVLEAPVTEPWKLVELLAQQSAFDATIVTEEDISRHGEYRAQAQRAELARSVGSRDEFLASMGIICTFQSALLAPLSRATQLLAKTNQFNLTTRRRSAAEVEEFSSAAGGQAVVVRVRDRFGDAGVVGLALARNEGGTCFIDSLLLSCRVIGRGIETALLAHIAGNAVRSGARRLVGEFVPTKKNAPCATFYADHGFTPYVPPTETASESIFYELDLSVTVPTSPTWITLEGDEYHELSTSTVLSA
jgi:FkbH-like protein